MPQGGKNKSFHGHNLLHRRAGWRAEDSRQVLHRLHFCLQCEQDILKTIM